MERREFVQKAIYIKGEVVNNLSIIEYLMNFCLANYMTNDKVYFTLAVLNKLNFHNRMEMFKHLLGEAEPDFEVKYPGLFGKINNMQELRNKFAHSILQFPHTEDYSRVDEFTLLKTDKFNANNFATTTYKVSSHPKQLRDMFLVIKTLEKISGISDLRTDEE